MSSLLVRNVCPVPPLQSLGTRPIEPVLHSDRMARRSSASHFGLGLFIQPAASVAENYEISSRGGLEFDPM
jgi:hypothetical protein